MTDFRNKCSRKKAERNGEAENWRKDRGRIEKNDDWE